MGFCECYCYREFVQHGCKQEKYSVMAVNCMRCKKWLWSESFVCLFVLQEWPNYNICFWISRVLSIVPSYGNIFGFVRRPVSGSTRAFVCTHWVAFKAFILGLCIFDTTCSHCCILHHILYYVMICFQTPCQDYFQAAMSNNFTNLRCLIFCSILPLSLCESSSPKQALEPLNLHLTLFWSVPYRVSPIYF